MSNILDAGEANSWEQGASFTLRHRLFRLAWTMTWLLLASWTPVFLLSWRRLLLRLFGAKIGRGAVIHGSARIWYPPNLVMEDFACIGPKAEVYCMAEVRLGDHAIISQGSYICAGTHDIEDPHFQLVARPITIGARAWIAAGGFVGPGVTVGEGAVLAARGAAFRNLNAWTVYSGNPAAPLKARHVRFAEQADRI